MRNRVAEIEATALDELKQQGMRVESEINKQQFQAALSAAYVDYAKRFGSSTLERIRQQK